MRGDHRVAHAPLAPLLARDHRDAVEEEQPDEAVALRPRKGREAVKRDSVASSSTKVPRVAAGGTATGSGALADGRTARRDRVTARSARAR